MDSNLLNKIYTLIYTVVAVTSERDFSKLPIESKLKSDLLTDYDTLVRPVYNQSSSINVTIDLALQQIIDVDEKIQLLKASYWVRLYWHDDLLQWNSTDYSGIKEIKIKPEKVWLPDISLYNSMVPAIHSNEMRDFLLSVTSEGDVMWLAPVVADTVCHFNVRSFPYDVQICNMTFGSWMYNGLEVDLFPKNPSGDTSNFVNNVEWHAENFPSTRKVEVYNCCPEPFPTIDYSLILERKPNYYITYLYVPSVVIIVASLFSFHLPPGCDAKVDLSVTGLLSQTVFLLLISDLMPPDAYNPPLLGRCLNILLVIQAAAVVVNVVIKRIHDDAIHKVEAPKPWMFAIMHYLKYPFLLCHIDYKKYLSKGDRKPTESRNVTNETPEHMPNSNGCVGSFTELRNPHTDAHILMAGEEPVSNYDWTNTLESGLESTGISSSRNINISVQLGIIIEQLKFRSHTIEQERHREEIIEQWRHIAAMYDRIAMVLFILSVVIISTWFMTLAPSSHQGVIDLRPSL